MSKKNADGVVEEVTEIGVKAVEGENIFVTTDFNGDYVFDELGLKSWEGTENGATNKLLTHVIFHPVQKSLNRLIQVDYTLRIQSLTTFTETSSTALSTSNTVSGTTSGGNTGY